MLETVEGALSADLVLLLLSPDSIPTAWQRLQWEPLLLQQPPEFGTTLAFLLLGPCRFPEVLRKQKFFDLSSDSRDGMRKLKRWLMEQNPLRQARADLLPPRMGDAGITDDLLEDLQRRLADGPGTACGIERAAALEFAYASGLDFDGVIWVNCARRSRAGVLGDTAHALDLKLDGSVGQNCQALRPFAAGARCLYVFDCLRETDRGCVRFSGQASVIFTGISAEPVKAVSLEETAATFARWRHDPSRCLRHLGEAAACVEQLDRERSPEACDTIKELGESLFSLLQQQRRLAEAHEVIEALSRHAWQEGDAAALRRWEWEKSWILESWDSPGAPRMRLGTTPEPAQLGFAF